MLRILLLLIASFASASIWAQHELHLSVRGQDAVALNGEVYLPSLEKFVSLEKGEAKIEFGDEGVYPIVVYVEGYKSLSRKVKVKGLITKAQVELERLNINLREVTVRGGDSSNTGIQRLNAIDGVAIYAAKKNEVLVPADMAANKAVNNARQVFSKVPGLNIWESGDAGVQLDIGARGLSPSRTSNFNVRQNGYDISADALGYPESYYTPPTEAVERIEVVRGAAGLQYGTQFGGMLNFVMKGAPEKTGFELESRQTIGSFGLFNSFNSIGYRKEKTGVYGFYQHKQSNGWRPNSQVDQNTGYLQIEHDVNEKLSLRAEYTYMHYLSQLPGGLTDEEFERDPSQSKRERNWFRVKWNLASLSADYKISDKWRLNSRFFALMASREALGNLERINRIDNGEERTLIYGGFQNIGNETRVLRRYNFLGNPANLLIGTRLYAGFTESRQGEASNGSDHDFTYNNPDDLEGSDYDFPSRNAAVFAENIFRITDKLSITPGVRFEYINTRADGWYKESAYNSAGELVASQKVEEEKELNRAFVLGGLGVSQKLKNKTELYANFSQNYRAITFNDIRVDNPNFVIDPNITDERGFNFDLGYRGKPKSYLTFDIGLFYLAYNNRIGFLTIIDSTTYLEKRLRTNVGDSRSYGLESFVEVDWFDLFRSEPIKSQLRTFVNFSYLQAEYVSSEDNLVEGKEVELVPPMTLKTGITYQRNDFKVSYQFSYNDAQFTDAYNTQEPVPTAIAGEIPAYWVSDLSLGYKYKWLVAEAGVNNLFDNQYFTRRATGYPGPGVIPAKPRNFYFTLGVKF
ncbi:TonB-dependent receptor family protein [Salibacter halophilus]|uniref:TonB-dependent receptor n=1 Tax=Salibacter halophilus TaxID=1803916 RepID=A0A6N6M915_9FLAO|nr:TonB-dependent receptor [Salibacter halophilus]KAB1065556.1 TonB-dependent receptor [Salibacter halophilus]